MSRGRDFDAPGLSVPALTKGLLEARWDASLGDGSSIFHILSRADRVELAGLPLPRTHAAERNAIRFGGSRICSTIGVPRVGAGAPLCDCWLSSVLLRSLLRSARRSISSADSIALPQPRRSPRSPGS